MTPASSSKSYVVRFRPVGPWRIGPDSGARDRVDLIYHSDALFSSVSSAMVQLGMADEWFDATARAQASSAVRFSSFYPFQGSALLIVPPRSLWPPVDSAKVRFKGARFVPLSVVEGLLGDKAPDDDRWAVDGESECLLHHGAPHGPFKIALRSSASVDRLEHGRVETHTTACLEFARDAGLWCVVEFADDDAASKWQPHVRSAFKLLADSGFGGERSRGWGRSEMPEWSAWRLPGANLLEEGSERAHWLLSLYISAESDEVDWKRGSYSTVARRGRVESGSRWGEPKHPTQMVTEGSVLLSASALHGSASNVAPADFPHPVYRAGFAVTVPIPWKAAA